MGQHRNAIGREMGGYAVRILAIMSMDIIEYRERKRKSLVIQPTYEPSSRNLQPMEGKNSFPWTETHYHQ